MAGPWLEDRAEIRSRSARGQLGRAEAGKGEE